jgi:DNA polymerase I-like protein with 3'-5' exonuclease and polymerase domains
MKYLNKNSSEIIFDIEANGLNPDKVWCIVTKEVDGKVHKFFGDTLLNGVKYLMNAEVLIGHNIIGYDIPVLEKIFNVEFSNKIKDTLVMSRLFNPIREGHGLEAWGIRLNKHKEQKPISFDFYDSAMLDYCTQDVIVNEAVYKYLLKEGKDFSEESIRLEHKVAKSIQKQQEVGFFFDIRKATELMAYLKEKQYLTEQKVQETFKPKVTKTLLIPTRTSDGVISRLAIRDDPLNIYNGTKARLTEEEYQLMLQGKEVYRIKVDDFNLGSRKQIGEYLIEFGWKPKEFTPKGQPIVDENVLKKIKNIPEAEMIADYLLYQKRIAQLTSWLEELDGERVHGKVISNGTITSRMVHYSPNMAQVPNVGSRYGKECRSCWTVPEGYKLVGIDASSLELRMLCHYMGDEDYTKEVISGDIHTRNQHLAGLENRMQSKVFVYAFLYGAGDAKIGAIVDGGTAKGKELKKTFLKNLPALKSLRDRVQKASTRGYLKGLDGRKIFVRSPHSSLNTLLQGGGSIAMKKSLEILQEKIDLNKLDAKFVANIHDEWQIQVKESQAECVGVIGVESIEEASKYFKMRCPLTGEYKIGNTWYETH